MSATTTSQSHDRSTLLADVEEDLRSELGRLEAEVAELMDDEPLESDTDLVDRASAVTTARARARRRTIVLERLQEVRDAIARSADGSLGRCEHCGEEIDGERLRALPTARACRRDAGCG